jgi:hypothetical protein
MPLNPGVASERAVHALDAAHHALKRGDCKTALKHARVAQQMSNICGCDGLIAEAQRTVQRASSCSIYAPRRRRR